MKRIQFTILAVAILAGCVVRTPRSKSGPAKPSGPVLARVNDQTLTRDQLMILFRGQIPSDVPREKLQSVLESWVNGELWCQEAMRLGIGQDETTQLALRNEERNFIAHLLLARIQDTISVTDAEVYDYFTNNKDDYLNSTSISYLMFYDSALAEKVHERLAAGTDFASVAKDFSSDQVSVGEPTRYFLRNDSSLPLLQLSPELNRAIFRLNKGDISPVVRVSVSGKPT
ncbi:MAG: peptidyl-prolyl cis-trans isomerase, partial [candidate division WOR-3 bacterium]